MTCLEVIEMIANIAVALAVGFSARALYSNTRAFRLQKQSSQATLFHSITSEINELYQEIGNIPEDSYDAKENWIVRLIGALEYYAFYANHHYLDSEMEVYYLPTVKEHCQELVQKYPKLAKTIKEKGALGELKELRKYYKVHLKEECPI